MPPLTDEAFDESFEDFKNSFSYGSRTDLSFKFLKSLPPEVAADFLAQVLARVGSLLDDASPHELIDLVYEMQVEAYRPKPGAKRNYVYEDRPFQELQKPLDETSVALLTSSGHFSSDDPPPLPAGAVNQEEMVGMIDEFLRRAPHLSEIPSKAYPGGLEVLHPGYDVRSVLKDPAVAFPSELLAEAENQGRVGRFTTTAYSFVGACAQGRLRKELDGWVGRWKEAGVEALFLVPV